MGGSHMPLPAPTRDDAGRRDAARGDDPSSRDSGPRRAEPDCGSSRRVAAMAERVRVKETEMEENEHSFVRLCDEKPPSVTRITDMARRISRGKLEVAEARHNLERLCRETVAA